MNDKRSVQVTTVEDGVVRVIKVLEDTSRVFTFKVKDPEVRVLKEIILLHLDSAGNTIRTESLRLTAANSNNFTEFVYTIRNVNNDIKILVNTTLRGAGLHNITLVTSSAYSITADNNGPVPHGGSVMVTVTPTDINNKSVKDIIVNSKVTRMDGALGEKSLLIKDIIEDITVTPTLANKLYRIIIVKAIYCTISPFNHDLDFEDIEAGSNRTLRVNQDPNTEFVEGFVNQQAVQITSGNQIVLNNIREDKNVRVTFKQKPYIVFMKSPNVRYNLYITENGVEKPPIAASENSVYYFTSLSTIRVEIVPDGNYYIVKNYSSQDNFHTVPTDKIKWEDLLSNKNVFIFHDLNRSLLFRSEVVKR